MEKMVASRLPADGEILEIGCGPGSFAEILEVGISICLDPIQAMLEEAEPRVNAKRRERGDPMAKFVEGTAEKLPFPDNSFDAGHAFSFRDWFDKEPVFPRIKSAKTRRNSNCRSGENKRCAWMAWTWIHEVLGWRLCKVDLWR